MYKINGFFYAESKVVDKIQNMTDNDLKEHGIPKYKVNLLRSIRWHTKEYHHIGKNGKLRKSYQIFKN